MHSSRSHDAVIRVCEILRLTTEGKAPIVELDFSELLIALEEGRDVGLRNAKGLESFSGVSAAVARVTRDHTPRNFHPWLATAPHGALRFEIHHFVFQRDVAVVGFRRWK